MDKKHPLYLEDLRNVLATDGIESLRGKSVLMTGATGMVGTMLVDALMMMGGVDVIAAGRDERKARRRLGEHFGKEGFRFLKQDVCQPFPDGIKADYIIPAASNTHPLAYSLYPVETMRTNLRGCENALELACRCGATVVYTSTNEVYGNGANGEPFSEESTGKLDLSNARACYNESKRAAEALCQSYKSERNVCVKIARLCRIFGPTMLESDSKASSQFIKNAIAHEDIVLKSEGTQYFSYTYVADAVRGLLHVLLHGENGVAYNVSNEKANVRLRDFARLCAACCGRKVVFDLPDAQETRGFSKAATSILDNTRLKSIGFRALYEMEDAVSRTIRILS